MKNIRQMLNQTNQFVLKSGIMRQFITLVIVVVLTAIQIQAQVAINTDGNQPEPSAGLDVKFTNKGLLPPRMTQA